MDKAKLIEFGLTEEQADKVMGALDGAYVTKERFNEVNEAKKTAETTATEYSTQLEELKKVDATALQAEIDQLKEKNSGLQLEHKVDTFLRDQKVKNPKTMLGLLDMSKVKLENDALAGLEEQITAIKASDAYLFADGDPVPGGGPNPPAPDASAAMETKMRAAAGLPTK